MNRAADKQQEPFAQSSLIWACDTVLSQQFSDNKLVYP